jgi:hypothetical protein
MESKPTTDKPKRMTRWENLQRAEALGQNHPDPKTRLLLKALAESEQEESGQLILRL